MSLWWAKKNQLDDTQLKFIEDLSTNDNHLVVGPPGSGKTNVLLRRAQFVRANGMPRVLVLSFTRPLTEFIKTGCYNSAGAEIFPVSLVQTIESWMRWLHSEHDIALPARPTGKNALSQWKQALAVSAKQLASNSHLPRYETIFVDEAQDLHAEELLALQVWANTLYFVGDSRQQIYGHSVGLSAVEKHVTPANIHTLPSHYRVASEIARVADKILNSASGNALASTGFYNGPKPGRFDAHGPSNRAAQMDRCIGLIKDQLRVYGDFFEAGDRIGVVVALNDDREEILQRFENDAELSGRSKIIRARNGSADDDYEVGFGDEPISIVTVQGCKGLEFRCVHWLFCDTNSWAHSAEHYYTVVTRAKTEMDVYHDSTLPHDLASAHADSGGDLWS